MMGATKHDMQSSNRFLILAPILLGASACSDAPSANIEEKAAQAPVETVKTIPARNLPRADRDFLQAKATTACECDLAKGKNCWSDYRAATKTFRPKNDDAVFEASTSCAPISESIDCMRDGEGPFCVVTGYETSGVNLSHPRLCRQEEVQAVEHAFNAEFAKPNGNQANADRAAKEALAAVRAGKASRAPATSSGCV